MAQPTSPSPSLPRPASPEYLPKLMVYNTSENPDHRHRAAQTGTNPDGSFIKSGLCGNNITGNCLKIGTMLCNACSTVQYCSKECQVNDWAIHKSSCHSARFVKEISCPYIEAAMYATRNNELIHASVNDKDELIVRPPTEAEIREHELYVEKYSHETTTISDGTEEKKYLWGRTPPLDILNLAANEGLDYKKPLLLNFRGVDDLRHVMKTIVSLPEGYSGSICCHIYEADFDLQIRNIIILLLAMHYPDGEAAELITYLWYSASIPFRMYLLLDKILKILKDVAESMKDAHQVHAEVIVMIGSARTKIQLSRDQFIRLYSTVDILRLRKLDIVEVKRLAFVHPVNPILKYKIECFLQGKLSYQRMTENRYRESGILLPMNSHISPLRCVNPTFYNAKGNPLLHPLASPLDNHDALKLRDNCIRRGLPPNDYHGAVFFETRDLVTAFCSRVAKIGAAFVVCVDPFQRTSPTNDSHFGRDPDKDIEDDKATSEKSLDTVSDATTMTAKSEPVKLGTIQTPQFDRILLYTLIGDMGSSKGAMLLDIGALLKSHEQNPHATVLALLPYATDKGYLFTPGQVKLSRYITRLLPFKWHVYTKRAHAKVVKLGVHSVHDMRKDELLLMEKQEEKVFKNYLEQWKIEELATVSGLKLKSVTDMSIGLAWPYRLEMSGTEVEQERQFALRFTSLMKGCERLVEFKAVPNRNLSLLTPEVSHQFGRDIGEVDFSTLGIQQTIARLEREMLSGIWD